MSTVQEITLSNVGPVRHASIPIPEPGGLVVLRGRNGAGKSKTLEAVESALTGRGKIEVRDGELRGEVEAFGVKLTVGRSMRRSGELEVETLEGKYDLSLLIDPGIKSPDAADAKRIKALVALTNVKPSPELFYALVGSREQFESLVSTTTLTSDDLVVMAERIKRDLESKARNAESDAEHAEGRARGAREAASGVDLNAPCDSAALQSSLESAIREESALKTQAENARNAARSAQLAKDQLEDAEASYLGIPLEDAIADEATQKTVAEEAEAKVREAERMLSDAKAEFTQARNDYSQSIAARKNAEQYEATIKQWREQIAASIPAAPSTEKLAAASEAVTKSRQAVELGALVRKAKQHLEEDQKHRDAAQANRKKADQLRAAAHGTDEVLSEVIAKSGSQLRVEHGRLVLNTRRGNTYFNDLSAGERSRIAVDIGIEAVGEHGVLTLSQEIFEGLDPKNREALANHAVERGVVILTAEASDDEEVTAEVYAAN